MACGSNKDERIGRPGNVGPGAGDLIRRLEGACTRPGDDDVAAFAANAERSELGWRENEGHSMNDRDPAAERPGHLAVGYGNIRKGPRKVRYPGR